MADDHETRRVPGVTEYENRDMGWIYTSLVSYVNQYQNLHDRLSGNI